MPTSTTKTWTVSVAKKDIIFDIEKMSMELAETSGGDDVRRRDRISVDTENDGELRMITRLCDHRMSRVRTRLSRFLSPGSGTTGNTTLSTGDYTLSLTMPVEAQESTLPSIADLIHDYIVTGALADYYAQLGVAANRESLNNTADAAMASLRELIFFRPMPR